PARATHDYWYFVWHEVDFVQGTWKRAEMLHRSTKFLRPMMYVDLIGSESLDLVQNVMERLRAHRPEMYGFKYSATVGGDTVLLKMEKTLPEFNTVKNEVLLSMVMQSRFNHVTFVQPDGRKTYSLKDVDLPWLDLRLPGKGFAPEEKQVDEQEKKIDSASDSSEKVETPLEEKRDTATVSLESAEGGAGDQSGVALWLVAIIALAVGALGFMFGRIGSRPQD
ncbi:MAG: hypothetical protein AB7H80_15610, partial [Candidatus Kapaibacterium sp.]